MSDNQAKNRGLSAGRYAETAQPGRPPGPFRVPIVYRIALAIGVLMVGCIGILASIIVQNQNQVLRQQIDDLGNTIAAQIARSVAEPIMADDQLALDVLTTSLTADVNVLGTAILSKDGKVLAQAGLTPNDERRSADGKEAVALPQTLQGFEWEERGRRLVAYIRPVTFKHVLAGHVVVTLSRAALKRSMENATRNIVLASILVLVFGGFLTYLLSRRLSRPIDELVNASRAMDEGSYDLRASPDRDDEIGGVMDVMKRMAAGAQRKQEVESTLKRYLSPRVARAVLEQHGSQDLGGRRVEATVLFADIVGFTSMAEDMMPEDVGTLLNQYFSHIARACEWNHGLVDKYIGDGAMLVFGTPEPDEDHCFHGIRCALTVKHLVALENARREKAGHVPVWFRFGLNSGSMLAGNMGANERMEYTVVGDSVNLASRLSTASKAGQIIITEAIYSRPEIRDRVIAREQRSIHLRGIQQPVATYVVEELIPGENEQLIRQVETLWWQARRHSA
jgi:adenylate cyclase